MKFRFEESEKEEVVVYAKEKNEFVTRIENICATNYKLIGFQNDKFKELNYHQIDCFFIENEKVYALIEGERYQIKKRIYELYNDFSDMFILINQSCLVNVKSIDFFDVSIGGSLRVVLKNGYKDYVSRRQVKNIKERIGLK